MKDLEKEFQTLMKEAIELLHQKVKDGKLTANEAYDLTRMVENRTGDPNNWHDTPDEDAWSQSTIDCMEAMRHEDEGWSPSKCW